MIGSSGRPKKKKKDYSGYCEYAKELETKLYKNKLNLSWFRERHCPELTMNQFNCQFRGSLISSPYFKEAIIAYLFNREKLNLVDLIEKGELLREQIETYADELENLSNDNEKLLQYREELIGNAETIGKWLASMKRREKRLKHD